GIRDRNVTGVQTCALPICLQQETLEPAPPERLAVFTRAHQADILAGHLNALVPGRGPTAVGPHAAAQLVNGDAQQRYRAAPTARSEERRVGKERRAGGVGE